MFDIGCTIIILMYTVHFVEFETSQVRVSLQELTAGTYGMPDHTITEWRVARRTRGVVELQIECQIKMPACMHLYARRPESRYCYCVVGIARSKAFFATSYILLLDACGIFNRRINIWTAQGGGGSFQP